jgi:hypothetical protein
MCYVKAWFKVKTLNFYLKGRKEKNIKKLQVEFSPTHQPCVYVQELKSNPKISFERMEEKEHKKLQVELAPIHSTCGLCVVYVQVWLKVKP